MNRLFVNNSWQYRLLRTIIQGIIGVIIANADYLVGLTPFPTEIKVIIVALTMAVLSPIMAALGTTEMEKPEIEHGFFEHNFEEEVEEDDDSDS